MNCYYCGYFNASAIVTGYRCLSCGRSILTGSWPLSDDTHKILEPHKSNEEESIIEE